MLTGLAWALRETHGPVATPAAPAASFRKSRRVAFDCAGCAIHFPLMCEVDGPWETSSPVRIPSVVDPPDPGAETARLGPLLRRRSCPLSRGVVKDRVSGAEGCHMLAHAGNAPMPPSLH